MNEVEDDLMSLIKSKEQIIFDVGCYRGNFTQNILKSKKTENKKFKFFLFDPNPNVKNYLKKLLENENIKYFQLALDNSNTIKKFTINRYFEPSGTSLNSAHKKDPMYNFSRKFFLRIFQPFKKLDDYEEIDVKTQTLDNFCSLNNIEKISLLKLDTDGTEYELLNGAKKLLSEGKIEIIYRKVKAGSMAYMMQMDAHITSRAIRFPMKYDVDWHIPHKHQCVPSDPETFRVRVKIRRPARHSLQFPGFQFQGQGGLKKVMLYTPK